jgi:hypothetical protein
LLAARGLAPALRLDFALQKCDDFNLQGNDTHT